MDRAGLRRQRNMLLERERLSGHTDLRGRRKFNVDLRVFRKSLGGGGGEEDFGESGNKVVTLTDGMILCVSVSQDDGALIFSGQCEKKRRNKTWQNRYVTLHIQWSTKCKPVFDKSPLHYSNLLLTYSGGKKVNTITVSSFKIIHDETNTISIKGNQSCTTHTHLDEFRKKSVERQIKLRSAELRLCLETISHKELDLLRFILGRNKYKIPKECTVENLTIFQPTDKDLKDLLRIQNDKFETHVETLLSERFMYKEWLFCKRADRFVMSSINESESTERCVLESVLEMSYIKDLILDPDGNVNISNELKDTIYSIDDVNEFKGTLDTVISSILTMFRHDLSEMIGKFCFFRYKVPESL